MIYKYNNDFFWFEDRYIISSHNGSSKFEYYSIIEFSKIGINDYELIKENNEVDFSSCYKIFTTKEFEEILLQRRREFKLSLILEEI